MNVQLLTYLFVGITFALYIGIAIWSKAQSTNDFYVAGKGVHPVANGMATAADWMSAASFYVQYLHQISLLENLLFLQ